jgi:hypothetical protein
MTTEPEFSESGAPIYRHQQRQGDLEPAAGDLAHMDRLVAHVEQHVGPVASVFHELLSDLVHLDVHMIEPAGERDYYTLFTTGMSERPMRAPADFPDGRFAEVLICLPPDWPLTQQAFEDESIYWPIRWLKMLARLPHQYDTWLFTGHTVPHGDPPTPFADNTDLCCALLQRPTLFGDEFPTLEIGPDQRIHLLTLVPLYREEMEFKLRHGLNALVERLDKAGVTELLDVRRVNVCREE